MKTDFEHTKAEHERAQEYFKELKTARDVAKREFDSLQDSFKKSQATFQSKLNEIKASNQRDRNRILDKAGVSQLDRDNAKIVKKVDGTTQIYHGGLGDGDGLGHGHIAIDQSGIVSYDRGAFESHGKQNYINEKTGWWKEPEHGIILDRDKDYEVTFKVGSGPSEGQTLIADGLVSKQQFKNHKNHNHYGPDFKYGDGDERIEDKGGDRGLYTGPGH